MVVYEIDRAKNNVVMDMLFVRMRCKNILVFSLKEFVAKHQSSLMYLLRCCLIRCKTLYDMVTENIPYISSHTSQFAELVRNLSCLFPKGIMQFRCFFGVSAFFNWEMASYLSVLRQILCRRKPRNRYSKRNLYASSGRISVQIRCHEQR